MSLPTELESRRKSPSKEGPEQASLAMIITCLSCIALEYIRLLLGYDLILQYTSISQSPSLGIEGSEK